MNTLYLHYLSQGSIVQPDETENERIVDEEGFRTLAQKIEGATPKERERMKVHWLQALNTLPVQLTIALKIEIEYLQQSLSS